MTLLLLLAGPGEPVVLYPGGGGTGAVMAPGFFERYEPAYESKAPESRYKPTLRRQK